jgi:nucleotide-binding universal stress UspA family protein
MIKRILVPVDFSPPSVHALDYAINFAKSLRAEVVLVFVVEPLYYAGDLGLFLEEQNRMAHHELAQLERRVQRKRGRCRTLVLRGTPYKEIVAAAKKHKTDLIVMGTHGRTGLSHLVMGSVADKVVRTATCPVLTVPQGRKKKG